MLANKYRPARFQDIAGQVSAKLILQSFVNSGDCPPAFLFIGPSGTGKTSTARIFAAALNCDNVAKGDCCGVCDSCVSIQNGSSSAVIEIDAASNGGVENIRSIKELTQYDSSSNWRVVILDEAHAMSPQAFNALLKVLEEPFSNTMFLLLTTEPHKILKTVASRAMPVRFDFLTGLQVADRLNDVANKEGIDTSYDTLKEIALVADGNLRNALMLLEQARMTDMLSISGVLTLSSKSQVPFALAESLLTKSISHSRGVLARYFDENSDPTDLVAGLIDSIQEQFASSRISDIQLMTAMKLLWDAGKIKSMTKDTRSQMDAMVTLLHGVLQPPVKQMAPKSILPMKVSNPEPPTDETISSVEDLIVLV